MSERPKEERKTFTDDKGRTWIVQEREPNRDELSLGWAQGTDNGERILVLKGVNQSERDTHLYVVGASGTGKTKFLEFLILQDIRNWYGFGVIDPHGDLIEEVKSVFALDGSNVSSRIVLIDPTDTEKSVCFNPLELQDGMRPAQLAQQLVSAFKKIYGDTWGARLEAILRNVLILLIENGQTLAEISLVLKDEAVRKRFLGNVKNETCREYFEGDFDRWSDRTRLEWTQSTSNKIDALLSDERIRRIFLSPKSSFSLRDIIDNGKILLVKLDKGQLGEGGELLGSLLLTKLQMASMARGDQRDDERMPFYLYIDEFQNFATESFIDVVNETRKYGLRLTLAHQNLGQLPTQLRDSVLNCGLQVYFRVARYDAELLAKEAFAGVYNDLPGWEEHTQLLQSLPRGFYVLKNKRVGGAAVLEVPVAASVRKGLEESDNAAARERLKEIGADYLRMSKDIEEEYTKRRVVLTGDGYKESFWEAK